MGSDRREMRVGLDAHLTSLAAACLPSPPQALLSVAWVVSSDTPSGIGKSLGSPISQRTTASWRSETCYQPATRLCDPVLARTCEGDEGPKKLGRARRGFPIQKKPRWGRGILAEPTQGRIRTE